MQKATHKYVFHNTVSISADKLRAKVNKNSLFHLSKNSRVNSASVRKAVGQHFVSDILLVT